MDWSSLLLLALWAISLGYTVIATGITLRILRNGLVSLPDGLQAFPITILKPLKGVDPGLAVNLESFFHLDYPEFEILFSVSSLKDHAYTLVHGLISKYPHVNAQLIVGDEFVGPNPKINNLVRSYDLANYDHVVICDSNIRVAPDYLRQLAASWKPDTGIVTALISGINPQGFGGYLEAMILNTYYLRGMCAGDVVGAKIVVGKTMLFKKSDLAHSGGLRALGKYLAEDYMAGQAIDKLGKKIVLMRVPIQQNIGKQTLKEYWSRHLRWSRIRKSLTPLAFAFEPLGGAIVSGLIGAIGAKLAWDISPTPFIAGHLLIWSVCDYLLIKRLDPKLTLHVPITWFTRELLALPIWLVGTFGNTVNWRGTPLAVKRMSVLELPPETPELQEAQGSAPGLKVISQEAAVASSPSRVNE